MLSTDSSLPISACPDHRVAATWQGADWCASVPAFAALAYNGEAEPPMYGRTVAGSLAHTVYWMAKERCGDQAGHFPSRHR